MRRGRAALGIVALIIGVGIVGGIVLGRQAARAEVTVETAKRGPLAVTVSASGRVDVDEKADIFPPAAGTLASVEVTDGQRVKAGDVIAVMDAKPLEAQVAQAQAAYEAALAQRANLTASTPGAIDEQAAAAAVSAAYAAYEAAAQQYEFVQGAGPDPTALAQAQAAVAAAQASYETADTAYTSFKASVYDPAPLPRDPALEMALAALSIARDQAQSALMAAQQNLAVVASTGSNPVALSSAKAAKEQAWAAYQAALAQQTKLAKTDLGAAKRSADAGVEAARAALDLAVRALEGATLTAPVDGTVVFNEGAASLPASALTGSGLGGAGAGASSSGIGVGSSVSPAAAPFSIIREDRYVFIAQVDEADIARIEVGMKATVTLDALPGQTFETTVERIRKRSVTTPTGGTAFTAVLRLEGADDRVLLGMNGNVDIEVESVPEAVSVPIESVLEEGDASYVFVIRDGVARRLKVTLGRLTDTRAEILSGVAEGDTVAVTGLANLKDGIAVKVK